MFFYPAEDVYGGKLPPPDVRQYAVKGIKIHLCGIDSGLDGLAKAEAVLAELPARISIAAHDLSAANAFIAGTKQPDGKITEGIFLNMATEWPLPELSPANHLTEADFPFRLLQQQMQPEEIMQYIIQQKNQQERIK